MKRAGFGLSFLYPLALAAALVLLPGCDEDGGGGPDGVEPDECADLMEQAHQALEDELYRLSQLPAPPEPQDIDFRAAHGLYEQVLAGCPEESSYEAYFASALTGILVVTHDPELSVMIDRWEAFADTATIFGWDLDGNGPAASIPRRMGFPGGVSGPVPSGVNLIQTAASLIEWSLTAPPQIEELQAILETEMIDRLDVAIDRMETVTQDPAFDFTVTPRMQGDEEASARELDLTEVYAFLAGASMVRAFAQMVASYSLNFATYDSAGLAEAIRQDSDFLALRAQGATHMSNSLADVVAALDYLEAGLDFLEAETDNQDDDLIVIDGEDGPTQDDLQEIRDELAEARLVLTGPHEFSEDLNGDGLEEIITLDISAFFNSPVENLKDDLLPPYNSEVQGHEQPAFAGEGGGPRLAQGGTVYCPVIEWQAETFEDWIFPDPTFGGLLPGMTDSELKSTFGMDAENWMRRLDPCGQQGEEDYITIDGYVICSLSEMPIAGALVATSLDFMTAMSGPDGHFYLETATPTGYGPYAICIDTEGYYHYQETADWGNHPSDLHFYLVPLD